MLIKVGHDELYNVTDVLKKDQEDYDKEIEKMLQQIEILRGVWQGQDAKIFCDKAHDYIENMKKITTTMGNIKSFCDKANRGFADIDTGFAKQLNAEANNYEE